MSTFSNITSRLIITIATELPAKSPPNQPLHPRRHAKLHTGRGPSPTPILQPSTAVVTPSTSRPHTSGASTSAPRLSECHQLGDASSRRVDVASGFDPAELGDGDGDFAIKQLSLHLRPAAAGASDDVSDCTVGCCCKNVLLSIYQRDYVSFKHCSPNSLFSLLVHLLIT